MIHTLEGLVIGEPRVKTLNTGSVGAISAVRAESKREARFDQIDIN